MQIITWIDANKVVEVQKYILATNYDHLHDLIGCTENLYCLTSNQ